MNIIGLTVERITVSRKNKAEVSLTAALDRPTNITTYKLLTINVKGEIQTD